MYPNYPYFAVAITRTCGSGGGSYIGKKLAKDFDIDLYDRKLLRLAAEDSGINEKIFAAAFQRRSVRPSMKFYFHFSLIMGRSPGFGPIACY